MAYSRRALVFALGMLCACRREDGGEDTDVTGAGDTDDSPDTDVTDDCAVTDPAPEGAHVWLAKPDGTCAQSPSHTLPAGSHAGSWSLDGGRVRFLDAEGAWHHASRDGDTIEGALGGWMSPDWAWSLSAEDGADGDVTVTLTPQGAGTPREYVIETDDSTQGAYWAPDGSAFVINLEDLSSIYGDGPVLLDSDLNVVWKRLGSFLEGMVQWSPDSTRMLNVTSTPYDDLAGAWVLPTDPSVEPYLLNPELDVSRAVFDTTGATVVASGTLYLGAPGHLWVLDPNGTVADPIDLWADREDVVEVIAAASTGWIAALVGDAWDTAALTLIHPDVGTPVHVDDTLTIWNGAFSPDGAWFAGRALDPETGMYEIFTVRADGSDLRRLTTSTDTRTEFHGWSPEGDRVLWSGPAPTP